MYIKNQEEKSYYWNVILQAISKCNWNNINFSFLTEASNKIYIRRFCSPEDADRIFLKKTLKST